jgi:phosphoribosyl 1,2-cyclic phosphate phosphodiesterase
MTLTLLGTGTSHGIPVIGCSCAVCASKDGRDKRDRASAFVRGGGASVLVDAGPEFRHQALARGITAIDAVLITHSHADHIHGIDDLRIFSGSRPQSSESRPLPLYANARTLRDIHARFSYIFEPALEGGGKPTISMNGCEEFTPESPLVVGGLRITHIPMRHGSLTSAGWVFTETRRGGERVSIAYLTDCDEISAKSIERIHSAALSRGRLAHVVLDALRVRRHSTHFCFDEALDCAARINGERTWLTHICHDMSHEQITAYCAGRGANTVRPAYDGLILEV